MSGYPYNSNNYGGGYPPHAYQQYYHQQQPQQQSHQQPPQQQQMWPQQQQQQQQHSHQQQHYSMQSSSSPSKGVDSRSYGSSSGNVLPPGISVVRDATHGNSQPSQVSQVSPFTVPQAKSHPTHQQPQQQQQQQQQQHPSLSNQARVSLSHVPSPAPSQVPSPVPSQGPSPGPSQGPSLSQSRSEGDLSSRDHLKQYKPLVKHFDNCKELGFDLSRVKTEPGLLLQGMLPQLSSRPKPSTESHLSASSSSHQVSTTTSKTAVTMTTPQEKSNSSSSNRSSDADSGMEEDSGGGGGGSKKEAENADSTYMEDTNDEEEEEEEDKGHLHEGGLPDTASPECSGQETIEFFSNLKNPVVGRDTLCIFCVQNCFDKNPKLLSCLHTVCGHCLEERLKNSLKNQKGATDVVLDLEAGATVQAERYVYCPLCKIKSLDNEVADNLIIMTTDQAVDGEDPEGQICNSCDEGNTPTQWCKQCSEYLCEDCVKAHQRVKITKDHTLKLVLSTKKQLSSSSSSVPSLEAFKICPNHSNEYLDYYCDNCDKATCRECQVSPIHQGHVYRSSMDASANMQLKFRQVASDMKLKRNALDENRSLLNTKLIEVDIKKKSLLTQLKDIQQNLIQNIESRFMHLISEVQKNISDKQKAITNRKETLDRLLQQANHSLAFVDHLANFTFAEQSGEHLSILAAKRPVERQMRRLKKSDISTGLTDQNSHFKLDAYFQQYSGSAMHEGLNSCLKQMLADVKVLDSPPAVPEAPLAVAPSPVAVATTSHLESALTAQKIVLKRTTAEQPSSPVGRFASPKAGSSPVSAKRGAPGGGRGGSRGASTTPSSRGASRGASSTSSGRGRGVAGRGTPAGGRGGRGGASLGRGASTTRGSKVARGGITNSVRAKTLAPNGGGSPGGGGQPRNMKPGLNAGQRNPPPGSVGRGRGESLLVTTRKPGQSHPVPTGIPAGGAVMQKAMNRNAPLPQQQQQHPRPGMQQQLAQSQTVSRPPVLQQMTQITVTSSNASRLQQQQQQGWPVDKRDWQQQQQQQSAQQRPAVASHQQQQNNYFMAAYGQQPPQAQQQRLPVNKQQTTTTTNTQLGDSLSITPLSSLSSGNKQPSWHSPQVETPLSGHVNPQRNASKATNDTSFKITLPSISKAVSPSGPGALRNSQTIPNNNSTPDPQRQTKLPIVKKEILDVNEELSPDKTIAPSVDEQPLNSAGHNPTREPQQEPTPKVVDTTTLLRQRTSLVVQRIADDDPSRAASFNAAAPPLLKEKTLKDSSKDPDPPPPPISMPNNPTSNVGETSVSNNNNPDEPMPQGKEYDGQLQEDDCDKLKNGEIVSFKKEGPFSPMPKEISNDAEDWCAICHDGGDVQYCCDRCPRVYHLYCYIPSLSDEPPDDWVCLMCATVDEVYQYSNNVDKGKLGERDLMICRRLLFELFNQYPQSTSFKDRSDINFPEYLKAVKEPIALDLIKERLDVESPEQYSSIEEFLADVRRMFKNCYTFHDRDSQWYQHAKELEEYLDRKLEEWIPQLAYDQTVINSSKSKKKRASEPTPGPSSRKRKQSLDATSTETDVSEQKNKKKSKKSKSKSKAVPIQEEDAVGGSNDDDESESFSEGEKLDYLDNLEAKLVKNKRGSELDEGIGKGKGSRTRKKSLKLKISKNKS